MEFPKTPAVAAVAFPHPGCAGCYPGCLSKKLDNFRVALGADDLSMDGFMMVNDGVYDGL